MSFQGPTPPDAVGEGLQKEELSMDREGFLAIMCTICTFLWQEEKTEKAQSGAMTSVSGLNS